MFRGLINDAKSAAGSLVAKYLARASVAVPFIIAIGFAIAAISHMLIARYGAITGCWILAGGFALIGLIATLVVNAKEHKEEVADKMAESADTANVATDAAAQAAVQAPLALVGALLSSPLGPRTLTGSAKALTRNLPLVVLMALLAMLFWPGDQPGSTDADADEDHPRHRANGADRGVVANGYHPRPVA